MVFLKERVRSLKQYTRKNNIEISFILFTNGKVLNTMMAVVHAMEIEVKENKI